MNALCKVLLIPITVLSIIMSGSVGKTASEMRRFGLLGGVSFPKFLFLKAQLNLFKPLAVDYQTSVGLFWTIQQGDILYFFSRGSWSPYLGVGYQYWNFYGFYGSSTYNGVVFGTGNQATAVTVPLGLLYTADNGFALDLNVAGDIFVGGTNTDLKGKIIPEGQISLGYFF